jgi:6-phosphogluconolactonase
MVGIGMKNNNEHFFLEQKELIDTLSSKIIDNLQEAILKKGSASLLVSGGSTPKPLFERLSSVDIPWEKVKIALCDERWIDKNHKDSNEKLVRDSLLVNFAKNAKFISMYQEYINIEDAQDVCSDIYEKELFPFDVLILGMGNDGHTASLFPNNIKLKEALETTKGFCICMKPDTAPYERMSLTKTAILSATNIYLHFEGVEKQDVYKKVLEGASSNDMPVSAILNQDKKKIEVYYK